HQRAADEGREQRIQIQQGDRNRKARRDVAQAKIHDLEGDRDGDGEQNALQLAAAIELAMQQRGQRDGGEGEGGERRDQALMPFKHEAATEARIFDRFAVGREEQLAEEALLRLARPRAEIVVLIAELERVLVEGKDRELASGAVVLLAIAVDEIDARAFAR